MKCYLSALLWKSSVHLFNCSNSKKDKMKLCSQMQSLKLCNTFFPTKFRKVCLNYFCKNISNSTDNKETLKITEGKLSELPPKKIQVEFYPIFFRVAKAPIFSKLKIGCSLKGQLSTCCCKKILLSGTEPDYFGVF